MANSSDIIKDTIRDFSDIQEYMYSAREENALKTYEKLKKRYRELKILLNALGVGLEELDRIKE